jgi:hypothetical protein
MHLEPVIVSGGISLADAATRAPGTILPKAARSAGTYTSEEIVNPRYTGVLLAIDLSGVDAGESLDVTIEAFDPISQTWATLPNASTGGLTANGPKLFTVHPAVQQQVGTYISAGLPPRWRVKATVAGGTVTFSIAGYYLA